MEIIEAVDEKKLDGFAIPSYWNWIYRFYFFKIVIEDFLGIFEVTACGYEIAIHSFMKTSPALINPGILMDSFKITNGKNLHTIWPGNIVVNVRCREPSVGKQGRL